MKVVFHLNEIERLKPSLSNIKNILKTDVEVVKLLINGDAINLFKDKNFEITSIDARFQIMACQNSMKAHDVYADMLPPNTVIVSSGVYTLMQLQVEDNFAYINS